MDAILILILLNRLNFFFFVSLVQKFKVDQCSELSTSVACVCPTSEQELMKCESVLYADCTTTGGQPVMSPRPILEAMNQLEGLLKKLEQVVMDAIKDIDQKKKAGVFKYHPTRCLECRLQKIR